MDVESYAAFMGIREQREHISLMWTLKHCTHFSHMRRRICRCDQYFLNAKLCQLANYKMFIIYHIILDHSCGLSLQQLYWLLQQHLVLSVAIYCGSLFINNPCESECSCHVNLWLTWFWQVYNYIYEANKADCLLFLLQ